MRGPNPGDPEAWSRRPLISARPAGSRCAQSSFALNVTRLCATLSAVWLIRPCLMMNYPECSPMARAFAVAPIGVKGYLVCFSFTRIVVITGLFHGHVWYGFSA